ncbi:WbqC-like protein [Segatella baroniae F0067]|uniref:WbqC-like protein n=1 Tax=Segatella baroniae F0067 TaxID=1115809 RepID=U2P208_9BACT|nr:WbqC family protein [Segatella baroniae]ERK38221.1 WbqC-like protein [Segatella baroniae F0067]
MLYLSSTYFGPVQWYQKLNRHAHCLIERHDNFVKQTYRNRMVIATTNGLQALSVPVTTDGDALSKTPMRDVRVSDHGHWRHIHWNALCSAYGESPFFEFYQDDIRPFFERRWDFLFDFNMAITAKMCELLDIQPDYRPTTAYQPAAGDGRLEADDDFRDVIRPKHPLPDPSFEPRRYYQVYEQKWGFQPNLSILDLLFNEGNEAVLYL